MSKRIAKDIEPLVTYGTTTGDHQSPGQFVRVMADYLMYPMRSLG